MPTRYPTIRRLILALSLALAFGSGLNGRAQVVIHEFMAINSSVLADEDGAFSDWIELRNTGTSSVQLAGWHLTDDEGTPAKWTFPATNLGPSSYLVVFASDKDRRIPGQRLHTNFKLDGGGEYLALIRADGAVADAYAPSYPEQLEDVSYGRTPEPFLPYAYFTVPTPGTSNSTAYLGLLLDPPVFSHTRGVYSNAFQLTLTAPDSASSIRYTLNGSTPSSQNGFVYGGAIPVSATAVVRAVAVRPGYRSSPVSTHTYLFPADVRNQSATGARPSAEWPEGDVNGQAIDYGMDPAVTGDPRYTNRMAAALLALPTISLVTDLANLFDATNGIYVNAQGDTREWERPVSVELFGDTNAPGFQINAGLRIRGGSSRAGRNPKHSFRLFFRSDYGAATLRYPLFGDEGVDEFDRIDLRTDQNRSWQYGTFGEDCTLVRDGFCRLTQGALGQLYTRSRFHHLYLNGVYWGIYQSEERIEASFAASYLGGSSSDYDAMKVEPDQGLAVVAVDGNSEAYDALWALANAGFGNATNYYRALGMNADGSRNAAYPILLDVDNLIDYMLTIYYTADGDAPISQYLLNRLPNNLGALYNRVRPSGFQFLRHDAENTLLGLNDSRIGPFDNSSIRAMNHFNPQWLHQQLMSRPEYRVRFADRTFRHLVEGAMAASNSIPRFRALSDQLDVAIIAESARWGDGVVEPPRTRDDDWLPEINWITSVYLPQRTAITIAQFQAAGWYPQLVPPVAVPAGGLFSGAVSVTVTAAQGSVYYTLDGSDPRDVLTGSPVGLVATGAVVLTRSSLLKARTYSSGQWSPMREATYVNAVSSPLRITEIMYHPRPPAGVETNASALDSEFEYVECRNMGTETIGLAGIHFSAGLSFAFSDGDLLTLAPGAYALVVRNRDAFAARYPGAAGLPIVGEFGRHGRTLSDSGELLALADGAGRPIQAIRYADSWQENTDGRGFSLTLQDPASPAQNWDLAGTWRASAFIDGSPGVADPDCFPPTGTVVINEALTHQDVDDPGDWVELLNTSGAPVPIGDWYLSDDVSAPAKYRIPAGTVVPAHGMIVFTEYSHFGMGAAGASNGFAFSELGESIVLSSGTNGVQTGYFARQDLGVAEAGITLGRYTTSDGGVDFVRQAGATRGLPNGPPLIGPIVISRIMYNPGPSSDAEFVELRNISAATVPLYDMGAPAHTWRLAGGISYAFAPGTVLPAGGRLIVTPLTPEAFRAAYPLTPAETPVLSPYGGHLDDAGERIDLQKPGDMELEGFVPYITVESVRYDDLAPWPTTPDGAGALLERAEPAGYADDPVSWQAAFPVFVTTTSTTSTSTTSTTTTAPGIPLGVVLEAPQLAWTSGGQARWFGETAVHADGVDAAQSGAIGHSQQSWMQVSIPGATSVGFWWRLEAETNDTLSFTIDGVARIQAAGQQGWRWDGFYIPTGVHTLKWTYAKSPSGSSGRDAAWVDGVAVGLFGEAYPLGGGWYWSDWFGSINTNFAPWLYHNEHAWLYPFGQDPHGVVFWDSAMNAFWWTGDSTYSYLYRFSDGVWLWYLPGSRSPRWMVNLTTGQWLPQ